MQERIDGLVRFSRVITQGREFQPVTLGAVVEEAVAGLGAEIEAAGAVVTHDDLPTVLGDGAQLRQALQILISNAVKFRGPDPPRVHIQAKPDGVEWVFAVSDNGIGMAPEYFDRIFVIFQQLHTRAEYPGAGVGLAVCKRILERHGGRMRVESEPGKGATFYFTLPRISKEHDGGVEQPSYEESLG
jgi:light-regulated signal transduction histidine kinase (bacteriophytochrome)